MNRRDFFVSTAVAGAGLAMSKMAFAKSSKAKTATNLTDAKFSTAEKSAWNCLKAAETCLAFCYRQLATGDSSMSACEDTVSNMIPVVEALKHAVIYRTASDDAIKSLAKTCAQFCRECESSCKEHAGHHKECSDCAKACAECAKACDDLVA